jgi:VanZ family protein
MFFCLRIIPMLLVMGIIFFLSHQPGDTLHLPSIPGIDKISHMFAYGLLALTVLWFFGSAQPAGLLTIALKTVLVCLLYGMTDEFHQSFIPCRAVSVFDLLADLAGAIFVCIIWLRNRAFRVTLTEKYLILTKRLNGYYRT